MSYYCFSYSWQSPVRTEPTGGYRLVTVTCDGETTSTSQITGYQVITPKPFISVLKYSKPVINQTETHDFILEYQNATQCYNKETGQVYYNGKLNSGTYRVDGIVRRWPATQDSTEFTVVCKNNLNESHERNVSYTVNQHPYIEKIEALFTQYAAKDLTYWKTCNNNCDIQNNALMMYSRTLGLKGILNMYLATGNTKYIQIALNISKSYQSGGGTEPNNDDIPAVGEPADNILGVGNSAGDYFEWRGGNDATVNSIAHREWRAATGIAKTVALVLSSDVLNNNINFRQDALNLADFLHIQVWNKWDNDEHTINGYTWNKGDLTTSFNGSGPHSITTHMIGRMGTIANSLRVVAKYQHVNNTNNSVYGLEQTDYINYEFRYFNYLITKGVELEESLETKTEDNIDTQNIRCHTIYYLGSLDCKVELTRNPGEYETIVGTIDMSHAGDTVEFITESYLAGHTFTSSSDKNKPGNIQLLVNRAKKNWIYNEKLDRKDFSDLVDGTEFFDENYKTAQDQWILLAMFDKDLFDL